VKGSINSFVVCLWLISINQSIKTNLYSTIRRERIRGALTCRNRPSPVRGFFQFKHTLENRIKWFDLWADSDIGLRYLCVVSRTLNRSALTIQLSMQVMGVVKRTARKREAWPYVRRSVNLQSTEHNSRLHSLLSFSFRTWLCSSVRVTNWEPARDPTCSTKVHL